MRKSTALIMALLLAVSFSVIGQDEPIVEIKTEYGTIKMKLYNETPIHRDNFLKLAKEGAYDDSGFHRIIQGFMIQGGKVNNEGALETLPAEIKDNFYHHRGALAAARMPDNVNPEKKSSPSQFYIVQGRKYKPQQIEMIGNRMEHTFTEEQKKVYAEDGGAPHLDGNYTVFGEVIEGMDVVDKIAAVEVRGDAPVEIVDMEVDIVKAK